VGGAAEVSGAAVEDGVVGAVEAGEEEAGE